MDNFTHSLAGWALGQTGLKTRTRKGLAALVLAANMPDIDVFFGSAPWQPLATHQGFTHGLVGGVLLLPILLAGLLWLLDRWQCARGATFRSGLPMHPGWLIALCYLGALTHPLLDMQTTYAVQLLSPLSTTWFHTETLFIIDAMIWTVLPFTIWLSRRRERRGQPWRAPAIAGLVAVCVYIALNGAISIAARHSLTAHLRASPDAAYAGEEPVLFWKRTLVWRNGDRIGQARFDPLRHGMTLYDIRPPIRDHMRDPAVRRAIALTPDLAPFLRWSTMPVAMVEVSRCAVAVQFGDARYMDIGAIDSAQPSRRPFAHPPVIVPVSAPSCPPPR